MRLQITDNVDTGQWDALVKEVGGTIFHSSGWAAYSTTGQPNASPRFFLLLSGGGERVGAALGFHTRSGRVLMAPLTGRLWFDAIPAVLGNDPGMLEEFLRLIEAYARQEGNTELDVGSFAWPGGPAGLDKLGFDLTRYWEFVIDLGQSEDELWNGMDGKRRWDVRKAMKNGVSVRDLAEDEGIRVLRLLQAESSKRIVARGGPDITSRRRPEEDPMRVLISAGVGRIVGADLGGETVSAAFFTSFNGTVYLTFAGHNQKGLKSQAPALVLWEMIRRYRTEGAVRFNLGGCGAEAVQQHSPEHGLYEYKKAFGGACIERTSGHKVLRRGAYRAVRFLKSLLAPHRQFK